VAFYIFINIFYERLTWCKLRLRVYIILYRECISTEDEYLVDLTESINKQGIYCLNESIEGTARKIFKNKDNMLDKEEYLSSNQGDPELLIYIPFNAAVKMKSMTLIGGEDSSAPSFIKLFVNLDQPDFDLIESGVPSQVNLLN
jgi:hypothetical protein